jgi:hypothetical protein
MGWDAWPGRQRGTRWQEGRWRVQVPWFKDISKVGDCVHLGDTCGRRRPCEGFGNNLKAMDKSILFGWCRDLEVRMVEFDQIRDNFTLGVSIDQFEEAVV